MATINPSPSFLAYAVLFVFGAVHGVPVEAQSPTLGSVYSTSGNPKAKGLVVTIKYPAGWRRAEGERPHIVQKFSEQRSDGLTRIACLLVADLPESLTRISEDDLYAELSSIQNPAQELRETFPASARDIRARVTRYDGAPGLFCEYVAKAERSGLRFEMRSIRHMVIHKGKLLTLECTVGGLAGSPGISPLYEKSRALFTMMGIDIVLTDKWTASSTMIASNGTSSFILALFVNFVVTWGMGLTPPLVVRYAIVRRPLSPKAASWIAAISSASFWIAFIAINDALGGKPGTGAVWIIMFFVARWIMSHGHVGPSLSRAETVKERTDLR